MMDTTGIRIALLQSAVSPEISRNLEITESLIREAADQHAQLVCLQELFSSPYFAQTEDKSGFRFAEIENGKISTFLSTMAEKYRVTLIGGSFFEKTTDNHHYNTTLTYSPTGKVIGKYRKMHIPHDPQYYEQFYFEKGDLGYVSIQDEDLNFASLICYDQWFPEPARILALGGVKIIFYPTAIGWTEEMETNEPFSRVRWIDAMRSHASLNGIFTAGINRVGAEGGIRFWGSSFVADPFGQIIAEASQTQNEVLVVDLDLEKVFDSQEGWRFLHNRRPDSYKKLV